MLYKSKEYYDLKPLSHGLRIYCPHLLQVLFCFNPFAGLLGLPPPRSGRKMWTLYLILTALAAEVLASPPPQTPHDVRDSSGPVVLHRADPDKEGPEPLTNADFETGSLAPWNFTQLGKPLGVAVSLERTEHHGAENTTAAGGHWHVCLSTNWFLPFLGTTKATLEQPLHLRDGVEYSLSWRMMGRGGDKVEVCSRQPNSRFIICM